MSAEPGRSRPGVRRLTAPLSLAALAAALFGAWMHWAVLDPRNVGWLLTGRDWGQNSLGLIAYLRARPPWPSLHDPLDPTRLYVLLRMRPPAAVAARVVVLDGVAVIPPERRLPPSPACVSRRASSSPRSAS